MRGSIRNQVPEFVKDDCRPQAKNQLAVSTRLQALSAAGGATLRVPELHPTLAQGSQTLLVMEFIEGPRITDGSAEHLSAAERVELIQSLIGAYATLMLVEGVFQVRCAVP